MVLKKKLFELQSALFRNAKKNVLGHLLTTHKQQRAHTYVYVYVYIPYNPFQYASIVLTLFFKTHRSVPILAV